MSMLYQGINSFTLNFASMPPHCNVLVIESNYAERSRIIQRFQEHQLRHKLHFSTTCNEALLDLFYFNKTMTGPFPETILLGYDQDNLGFINKINEEPRYKSIKIFVLIEEQLSFYKERLKGFKIHGIIDRKLDFKNFSSETYLDTLDLFLHLLKVGLDKNNRVKHLLRKD